MKTSKLYFFSLKSPLLNNTQINYIFFLHISILTYKFTNINTYIIINIEVINMKLKGSKTMKNLMTAFAGECQAAMRYMYFAKTADKEGFVQISRIFEETMRNEQAHAKRLFKYLNEELKGEEVEIEAAYPVQLGNTKENLESAYKGENFEAEKCILNLQKLQKKKALKKSATHLQKLEKLKKHTKQDIENYTIIL